MNHLSFNGIYLQYYIDNLLSLPYNTICKVFDVLSSYTFYVKMSSSRISMDIQKSGSFFLFCGFTRKNNFFARFVLSKLFCSSNQKKVMAKTKMSRSRLWSPVAGPQIFRFGHNFFSALS